MMTRSTLWRAAAAGVALLVLVGCGQLRPSNKIDIYEAVLNGAQEVPSVSTSASGQAEAQFNNNTSVLTWKVSYGGLSAAPTGGHIHGPAGPGQNAGVVIPFGGNLSVLPITGQATLTAVQAGQLGAGLWYVNLHTGNNPNGEIRGQLRLRR